MGARTIALAVGFGGIGLKYIPKCDAFLNYLGAEFYELTVVFFVRSF
jgi:hypothetical protein